MLTETDVTIYNRWTDKNTCDVYFTRTVLKAHTEPVVEKSIGNTNIESKNATDVFIPVIACEESGKEFVSSSVFANLDEIDRKSHFTFSKEDVIILEPLTDEIPVNGLKEFRKKHPEALTIQKISSYMFGSRYLKHWEIRVAE